MQVLTGAKVLNLESSGEEFIVRFSRGGRIERCHVGAVFAAVGWPANLEHLDLGAAGVTSNRQAIPVDDYLRVPTSSTSSAPVTSTGDPSWSRPQGSRAA